MKRITDALQRIPVGTRAWVYRTATAAAPLLVAYGVVDEKTVALWLGFAGTLLGTALAAANTPRDFKS